MDLRFPEGVRISEEAKDFIRRLLVKVGLRMRARVRAHAHTHRAPGRG